MTKRFMPILLLMVAPAIARGASTGASFLLAAKGPAQEACGGAIMARTGSKSSIFWNPGAMGGDLKGTISLWQKNQVGDVRVNNIKGHYEIKGIDYAVEYLMLAFPEQMQMDSNGVPGNSFNNKDSALALGVGKRVGMFGAGAALVLPRRELAGRKSDAVGVNLGLYVNLNKRLNVGAGVINRTVKGIDFGGGREQLPTEYRIGLEWKYLAAGTIEGIMMMDTGNSITGDPTRDVGFEFVFDRNLFLRAGITSKADNDYRLGLGWDISRIVLDYSVEFHPAGSVQSIGLTYKWGKR